VEVSVDERGVRVPPGELRTFWGAFVHALRNALDHGVEPAEERAAMGKPQRSRITLKGELEGFTLVISIEDDGSGIDFDALREVAARKDLPAATHEELMEVLFADGVSTRAETNLLSGRGVGLAALRQVCEELGGAVGVDTKRFAGTRFTFRLPMRRPQASFSPPQRPATSLTASPGAS
jgi:two-component system chemotaxis sensor kinase CheA